MRLRGVRRSRNVDDRRGRAAPVAAGVGGLGIIGVLLALLLGGSDGGFSDIADQLQGLGGPPPNQAAQELSAEDQAAGDFIAAVLGTTEEFWGNVFASAGQDYPEPILVLFTRATQSACGGARAEVGPHYCPLDRTIYMDRAFFDELQRRFGASSGDFAEAYVVAHEVGHHVQNVLDIMGEVRGGRGPAGEHSRRHETGNAGEAGHDVVPIDHHSGGRRRQEHTWHLQSAGHQFPYYQQGYTEDCRH